MSAPKNNLADPSADLPPLAVDDHPFFHGLGRESSRSLAASAAVHHFKEDDVIFVENSSPDAMFLVLKGKVSFVKGLPGGGRRIISYAESGDFFGEIGVFSGAARALSAVATCPTQLARLTREDLTEFIRRTPGPIEQILQSIVGHLHHTTSHYVEDMIKQEKMALVGNMVNSIIHDFKNPFTLISLGAQLIMQKHHDERTLHLCANMIKQVERMVEMAGEISEFSKGTQTLKLTRVDLSKLAELFRALNEPFFQQDNVNLEFEVAPVVIEAEENKILRVLQNLVGNALEAVEGAPGGLVRVRIRDAGDDCEIIITDNGKGIPEQIRNTLFEPFVTFGKSRGTGLGTAIVKSIVEAHHGRIRFETVTDKGTSFFITLPKTQGVRS